MKRIIDMKIGEKCQIVNKHRITYNAQHVNNALMIKQASYEVR